MIRWRRDHLSYVPQRSNHGDPFRCIARLHTRAMITGEAGVVISRGGCSRASGDNGQSVRAEVQQPGDHSCGSRRLVLLRSSWWHCCHPRSKDRAGFWFRTATAHTGAGRSEEGNLTEGVAPPGFLSPGSGLTGSAGGRVASERCYFCGSRAHEIEPNRLMECGRCGAVARLCFHFPMGFVWNGRYVRRIWMDVAPGTSAWTWAKSDAYPERARAS